MELTKDADKLICLIYKEFLRQRGDGVSRDVAAKFRTESSRSAAVADFPTQDIPSARKELKDAGLMKVFISGEFELTSDGIIYMENRFPGGTPQLIERLTKLKNAIPFL